MTGTCVANAKHLTSVSFPSTGDHGAEQNGIREFSEPFL